MSDEEIGAGEMRNALSAIANEVQKFQKQSDTTSDCNDAEILNKLIKYKFAIKERNVHIKHLRSNLKTACDVAKTISSAKTTEITSLRKLLDYVKNQYFDLEKQQSEKNEIINTLSKENHALRDQFEFFSKAIQVCYQQLKGMRHEQENVSTLKQLKYIIVCCGQYHTDYSNEHEKCIRLQQKNRFLSTKIIIMENNLEAARDELRHLRTCIKPYKEKSDALSRSRQRVGVVCSDYKLGAHEKNFTKLTMTKVDLTRCSSLANIREFDLTTHLKRVKKLLDDHDNLINDLKCLSRVINVDKTYWTIFFVLLWLTNFIQKKYSFTYRTDKNAKNCILFMMFFFTLKPN